MSYEIKIRIGVGDIKLGMNRQDIKLLFDDFKECKEVPYGYDREVISDYNDDFMVYYDVQNNVNFILCTNPENLEFNGNKLIDYTLEELYSIVKEMDSDVDITDEGFTSDNLGFGISTEIDDDENEAIESVQIAVKDFWKNEPM